VASEHQDFEPYVAAWRERWAREARERTRAIDERRVAALSLLPRLASVLQRDFGASRIWVVGSLARGDFSLGSDIDLAVEGLPLGRLFEAEGAIEALCGQGFRVDLVPLELARPRFRDALAVEGRLIQGGA
jgi:predicted nucleotidyltransferase